MTVRPESLTMTFDGLKVVVNEDGSTELVLMKQGREAYAYPAKHLTPGDVMSLTGIEITLATEPQ